MLNMVVCKGELLLCEIERQNVLGLHQQQDPEAQPRGGGGLQTLMCWLFGALRLLISQPENTDH